MKGNIEAKNKEMHHSEIPKTVGITAFFNKSCIATRTKKEPGTDTKSVPGIFFICWDISGNFGDIHLFCLISVMKNRGTASESFMPYCRTGIRQLMR